MFLLVQVLLRLLFPSSYSIFFLVYFSETALVIKSSRVGAFDTEDQKLFEIAAHQVAIALDWVERARQTHRLGTVAGITAWASEVAHDLRHRSALLDGYLESLYQVPELPAQAKRDIEKALETVYYLRSIAKAQASRSESFVLYDWLNEHVQCYISEGKMKSVNFRWIDSNLSVVVLAKKEPVWRAIRHVINNAVSAMTTGDWLGEQNLVLKISNCIDDPDKIELHIKDSGPGIPKKLLSRIFTERCNLEHEESDRGYGLLLARSLVEGSGGSIFLQKPEDGKGSTFTIRLPMSLEGSKREALL
jgi:signal transduction histidine kinase